VGIIVDSLGVRVGTDHWLFRELDLMLRPGQSAALVGPNGSGKSTLLRCLYGTQTPSAGSVTVAGRVPDERSIAFRRKVSVLLDDSDFFPELTAVQHLELLAGSFAAPVPDIDELLADAGLAGHAGITAGGFSAGQRRRLLLLGATARPFEVLLLDEPERALDPAGKEWVGTLVGRATGAGATVVLATHHPGLIGLADTVVELG
jgi:ABC-2 type transport system ATP-binding protein